MSDFSKTLALIGLLTPLGASALGVGDIRTQSSLNQTLRAEIPLVLSGNDRLENIQIRLASPEAFEQAGVERQHGLTQLRFKPVIRPDGRHVILVSSREAITDPFLDFLIEIDSPQGTVLREFTLLLDPSRGINSRAQPPEFPAYPSRSSAYDEAPRPRSRAATVPYPEPALEAPVRYPDAGSAAMRPTAITPEQLSGRTYGPVGRRERLIDVANRIERPAQVTPEQMALGLYQANPRAFTRNINGLKAGSVLRIPNDTYLNSLSQEEAQAALARRPGKSRRPAYADSFPPPVAETSGVAPIADTSPAATTGAGARMPPGVVSEVAAQVPSALKKENEALQERLTQLEQRLNEAQRLLKLKDAELATLQSHHSSLAREIPPRPDLVPRQEPAPTTTPAAVTTLPNAAPPAPRVELTPIPATSPARAEPNQAQAPRTPAAAPKPVNPPPVAVSKPVTPVADTTLEDLPIPMNYWLASGGLVLLGLSALLYRLRRKAGEPLTESPIPDRLQAQSGEVAPPATGNSPGSPASSTAEVTEIHPDQLDPAWEADVYLRYGRYPQAETLIRASLKREPDREDLKLKLCEILNLSRQSEVFAAYILELQATGEALSSGFWSAVQAMRPELLGDITPQPTHTEEPEKASSEIPAVERAVTTPVTPPTTGLDTETLDLEDTDFSAELLALEAQLGSLAEPGPAHTLDAMGPEVVSLSTLDDDQSLEQALEALTDLKATPTTNVDPEITSVKLDERSEAIYAVDGLTPDTASRDVDFHQSEELAAPLAKPENEPGPGLIHDVAALAETPAEATDTKAAPALPEHDNLLEFVRPVMEELLPDDASKGVKAEALILENLIPFDTSGLSRPSALRAQPAAPATAAVPAAQALTDELDFESLPTFSEDSGAARNADFGVLDFELDLIDPGAQDVSQPEATADSTSPEASPLDIARRLARGGDKIAARQMLKDLIQSGEGSMQDEARLLLEEISKVRLSLVTGPVSETPPEVPFVPAAKATPGA